MSNTESQLRRSSRPTQQSQTTVKEEYRNAYQVLDELLQEKVVVKNTRELIKHVQDLKESFAKFMLVSKEFKRSLKKVKAISEYRAIVMEIKDYKADTLTFIEGANAILIQHGVQSMDNIDSSDTISGQSQNDLMKRFLDDASDRSYSESIPPSIPRAIPPPVPSPFVHPPPMTPPVQEDPSPYMLSASGPTSRKEVGPHTWANLALRGAQQSPPAHLMVQRSLEHLTLD